MKLWVWCLVGLWTVNFFPDQALHRRGVEVNQAVSNERARQVLDDALERLGGAARLQTLTSIMMKGSGQEYSSAESQGDKPDWQSREDYRETLAVFPSGAKLAFEHRTDKGSRTVRWRRWLYSSDERRVADYLVQASYTRRNISTVTDRARQARRIPHYLLLEAGQNSASLQLLSDTRWYGGRRHRVMTYTPPGEKINLALFFDSETGLLSKFEYHMDFPTLGDVVVEYGYSGYRQDQRLGWVPTRHVIRIAGKVALQVDVEMAADTREAEELFQLPEFPASPGGKKFQLPAPLQALAGTAGSVIEAAPGVNFVEAGGFTVMFIEFKDFVFVAEAPAVQPSITYIPADNQPGSTVLAETFIQKIKAQIPDKPIKYLAVTHYHSDHSGGARAYMAEGARILTTPGNQRFFEEMASARFTFIPDRFSAGPRRVRIETLARKRVITDGERTVELINVGPNPHSQESLVIYLPAEKILFQGDLFYFDLGAAFPPGNRKVIMSFFARWLKDRGLAPARIYSVHSHGFATPEHVQQVLEAGN